ncbi:hypothetical protein LHGZ1_1835 [Laribacter hongkongensis]|uniref:Uncharacterized protein n=1 Tax=Laribacter hongkongensis TaxID=168471 RepID=A0A248LJX6_9NEIS|nr:hypothetical protein LHGZ1_1835 [Laribacter hongkongensis]
MTRSSSSNASATTTKNTKGTKHHDDYRNRNQDHPDFRNPQAGPDH